MHTQQQRFCEEMRTRWPEFFTGVRVVDFGSLDINGSNRDLFADSDYTGIDLGPGKGVDVVCRAHTYTPSEPVDIVISTEMLEHDAYWEDSLENALRILRKGGLLLCTCASSKRPEHGTTRSSPADAPFVGEYYRGLEQEDIVSVFDIATDFDWWMFSGNEAPGDLYFCGRKA